MSATHIPTEISVGPESAFGRSINGGVSALLASWIDLTRMLTTNAEQNLLFIGMTEISFQDSRDFPNGLRVVLRSMI
jgi:hypothetical protein